MQKKLYSTKEYRLFIVQVKNRILSAQYVALKAVNKELIDLYWDIGKMIIEKQEESSWGKAVVETISIDLQKEFIGIKGFSASNIWRMRNFYFFYAQKPKLAPLVREISWTKNVVIMERCKEDLQREFYLKMIRKFLWTKSTLIHQIENQSYEKYLMNQTNFDKSLPAKLKQQAILAVKDQYTFDFFRAGRCLS